MSLFFLMALVRMKMQMREATEHRVKMSKRKWASMVPCSEVVVEEASGLVVGGRAVLCLHIPSM